MKDCKLKWFLVSCYEKIYSIKNNTLNNIKYFIMRHLPLKKNKIVFDNFLGNGYGGNPKYIAEEFHRQGINCDLVWLAKNVDEFYPEYIRVVKYGSIDAHYELSTAKIFVDNVRNSNRVAKKKGQIYLQTWHGSGQPIKKIEKDAEKFLSEKYVEAAKLDGQNCDAILASNKWQYKNFDSAFWLNPKTEILCYGLPQNDILFDKELINENREKIKKYYNISDDTGIVLYMPTFRDNCRTDGYLNNLEEVVEAFEDRFGKPFICLVRFHPNVAKISDCYDYNDKVLNVTMYPDVQELYGVGDFLITDYSSTADFFSLLCKPVFICTIDFKKYSRERPLYDEFTNNPYYMTYSSDELIDAIKTFDYDEYWKHYNSLASDSFDRGQASYLVVEWIKKHIKSGRLGV